MLQCACKSLKRVEQRDLRGRNGCSVVAWRLRGGLEADVESDLDLGAVRLCDLR